MPVRLHLPDVAVQLVDHPHSSSPSLLQLTSQVDNLCQDQLVVAIEVSQLVATGLVELHHVRHLQRQCLRLGFDLQLAHVLQAGVGLHLLRHSLVFHDWWGCAVGVDLKPLHFEFVDAVFGTPDVVKASVLLSLQAAQLLVQRLALEPAGVTLQSELSEAGLRRQLLDPVGLLGVLLLIVAQVEVACVLELVDLALQFLGLLDEVLVASLVELQIVLGQTHLVFAQSLSLGHEASQLVLSVTQLRLRRCCGHAGFGLGPVNG